MHTNLFICYSKIAEHNVSETNVHLNYLIIYIFVFNQVK